MRRLTTIHVGGEGLKGRPFDVDLTGADLLAGPNKTGKTTVLLAVPIGLRGLAAAPPDLKAGPDGREYLGAPKFDTDVELIFDDGERVVRDLSKPKGGEAMRSNAEADRIVGPHLVRYDLVDFASTTDSARAKLLEQACAAGASTGGWTTLAVVNRIRVALGLPEPQAETPPIGAPDPVRATQPLFSSKQMTAPAPVPEGAHVFHKLLVVVPPSSMPSPSGWLSKALEVTGKVFTDANAEQKSSVSDAASKAADVTCAAPISGSLAAARAKVDDLEKKRRALGEGAAVRGQAQARRADALATEQRLVSAVARADAVRATMEAKVEGLRTGKVPDLGALRANAEAAKAARDEAIDAETRGREDAARLQVGPLAQAAQRLAEAEARLTTMRALADETLVCAHCGAANPVDFAVEVGRLENERDGAQDALDDATTDYALANAAVRTATATVREKHAAWDRACDTAAREERVVADLTRDLRVSVESLTGAQAALDEANAAFVAHRARQAEADATVNHDAGDEEATEAERVGLDTEIRQAKAEVENHVRHAERNRALQEAVAKREAALTRFEQVKALKAALLAVQEDLAKQAYAPIEKAANALLERAGIDERVVVHDASDFGAEVTDPGGRRVYVPFPALCGSEKALIGATFAYAFARLSGSPWPAVLIDGLDAVDTDRRPGLLDALAGAAAEGLIANFIGTMWAVNRDDVPDIDGLNVMWTGA